MTEPFASILRPALQPHAGGKVSAQCLSAKEGSRGGACLSGGFIEITMGGWLGGTHLSLQSLGAHKVSTMVTDLMALGRASRQQSYVKFYTTCQIESRGAGDTARDQGSM